MQMNFRHAVSLLSFGLFLLIATRFHSQNAVGTGSIEGVVVRAGTNTPIAGVDVELSRVEGTVAAPAAPGSSEAFAAIIAGTGGPGVGGATPPPVIAGEIRYAKSGPDGKFTFKDLKEGKYRMVGMRIGGAFYPAEFGQRDLRGRGLNFPLAAGEAKKDLRLEMQATAVVTGRVLDDDGQPMGHVVVMGLTQEYRQGESRLYIDRQVLTDSNGDYRLYWLSPVPHYVAAVLEDPGRRSINLLPYGPPGRGGARNRATSPTVVRRVLADGSVTEHAYGVTYYPSVADPRSARLLELKAGETLAGIDIAMGAGKTRSQRIRGTVINGATGQPAPNARVLAIPTGWSANSLVLTATADDNGVFDLAGAVPNSYLLTAAASTPNQFDPGLPPALIAQLTANVPAQVGYLPVDMGSTSLENVRIITIAAINATGRVAIEGRPPGDDPDIARITIGLTRFPDLLGMPEPLIQTPIPPPAPGTAVPARLGNGQAAANGNFNLTMTAGEFRVNVNGIPPGHYVKAIRAGTTDVLALGLRAMGPLADPIEIVLASDGGSIRGAVFDDRGVPYTNATVALIPETPDLRGRLDLYFNTTSDFEGTFQITAIPPGNYKLYSWSFAPIGSWQTAEFLRNYESSGQVIRVAPASRQADVRLTLIPLRK
jgi:hypothetical protein